MAIQRLLLITGNAGKAEEFRELLHLENLELSFQDLPIEEIQSLDLDTIGRYKTEQALKMLPDLSLYDAIMTDDTALSCKALNGLPGPFIKWFLKSLGAMGIYDLVAAKDRTTEAVCLLTVALTKTGELFQFHGVVPGELVPQQGKGGFGWDGVFLPQGSNRTYGEFTLEEKNQKSHRALAVKALRDWMLGLE